MTARDYWVLLFVALLLGGCGVSRPKDSAVVRAGDVDVGVVKRLEEFQLSSVWGYTGMVAPALPFGGGPRGRLFFLQPFEPGRVPVIFVYGMTGSPPQFETMVRRLDRTKFQPWVFHYRTGERLHGTATQLAKALSLARTRFGTNHMILVAHSMGGLVARDALNVFLHDGNVAHTTAVPCFVTLASPLGGHPGAADGAKAPGRVPAWTDLAPGSQFLQALYAKPLSDAVRYLMITATGADGTTDGVVPFANQTPTTAITEADVQYAYPVGHVEVLAHADALADLHTFLGRCAP